MAKLGVMQQSPTWVSPRSSLLPSSVSDFHGASLNISLQVLCSFIVFTSHLFLMACHRLE